GVLVVQRREARELPLAEVALVTALAAPVGYAIERARVRAEARAGDRTPAQAARSAKLDGRSLGRGVALGRAPIGPAVDGVLDGGVPRSHARPGHAVALALASLSRELGRTRAELETALAGDDALAHLRGCALLLEDLRFRDLAMAACAEQGTARGLA